MKKMLLAVSLFIVAGCVAFAAPQVIKNDKAITQRQNDIAADAVISAIKTNADYATYTNIISLLQGASSWGQAQPLLIKYFSIEQELNAAEDIRKGKKDKSK